MGIKQGIYCVVPEIAEALNIPVETVNKKLRVAVLDLRAALM